VVAISEEAAAAAEGLVDSSGQSNAQALDAAGEALC
jgi:hypothetical protein